MSIVSLTPFVTFTLIMMDLMYILQSIVVTPLVWLIKKVFCCCKKKDENAPDFNEWIEEEIYKRTFSMNREEIVGFRRLRTISQLMFETIPQIFLQIRVLIYFQNKAKSATGSTLTDIDVNSVLISILFACLHGGLEIVILIIEARIFEETIYDYFVICINGRLGWVPFMHKFRGKKDPEFFKKIREEPLRYDEIQRKICGNNV
jgi:hypothetical protein